MLNLEEQLGQILVVGVDEAEPCPELEAFVNEVRPGGVIFFQRNIKTAGQFRGLVERIREFLKTPAFLCLDLEGGLVDRLRDVLAPLAAVRDAARAGLGEQLGRTAGRELAAFSLNVDFAPVLDLGVPESRKVLGSRTAGETPEDVERFGRAFLKGLAEFGIVGCGKHFPGLGAGQKDSHKEMPSIEKTREMWEEDLQPFRLLAGKLPMIMVAHVYCPGLKGENAAARLPATLSRSIVTGLLKGQLGFRGLVLSDDLEMHGVLEGRSMEEAAVAALKAGCDVLLVCGAEANTRRVFQALLREATSDPDFRRIVEQAAEKVLAAKAKLGIIRGNRERGTGNRQEEVPDFEALRREIRQLSAVVKERLSAAGARKPEEA